MYSKSRALAVEALATLRLSADKFCVAGQTVFALKDNCIQAYVKAARSRRLELKCALYPGDGAKVEDLACMIDQRGDPSQLFAVSESGTVYAWSFKSGKTLDTHTIESPVKLAASLLAEGTWQFHHPAPAILLLSNTSSHGAQVYTLFDKATWHVEQPLKFSDGRVLFTSIDDDGRAAIGRDL